MSSVSEEIQQLQLRILELEKQQKERDEYDKNTNIALNFRVITNFLHKKKTLIASNNAPHTIIAQDIELVTHLDAVFNILQIINERLQRLEQNYNPSTTDYRQKTSATDRVDHQAAHKYLYEGGEKRR